MKIKTPQEIHEQAEDVFYLTLIIILMILIYMIE
jgi:hypothetical protein